MYNDRRVFFGRGPGIVPNDNFTSAGSSSPNADRRNSRARGKLLSILSLQLICHLYHYFWDMQVICLVLTCRRTIYYAFFTCIINVDGDYSLLIIQCEPSHVAKAGAYMPPGLPNGTHKPGVQPTRFEMPQVPLPPFPGPPSQPYAIPTHEAIHGPVGAVPQVPQPGNRGFGAGCGNAGAPNSSHLQHQQGTPQNAGTLGSAFNFPPLENPNGQPSMGGQLSQPGFVNNVCTFIFSILLLFYFLCLNTVFDFMGLSVYYYLLKMAVQGPSQSLHDGFSRGAMSQVFYFCSNLLSFIV